MAAMAEALSFKVGDRVVWKPSIDPCCPQNRRGDGPFTVVSVQEVPNECSFPDTMCWGGNHHPQCDASTAQDVGHHQWLVIRLPDGTIPQDTSGQHPRSSLFSGYWFVLAS